MTIFDLFFFFFFQAEDGIRDFHVTGVQTCALPISLAGRDGDAGRSLLGGDGAPGGAGEGAGGGSVELRRRAAGPLRGDPALGLAGAAVLVDPPGGREARNPLV